MKKVINLLVVLLTMFALMACTNQNHSETENNDVVVYKDYTYTIAGSNKSISVPVEPERIVVIGYDLVDIIENLGQEDKIVGLPDPSGPIFPSFLNDYSDVASIGSLTGDDFEAIAKLNPDLILAGQRASSSLDELNKIAPTAYFSIPGLSDLPFEEQLVTNINDVAYLLNVEDEAPALIDSLTSKIDVLRTKLVEVEDPTTLFLILTGKTINMYSDNPSSRYDFVFSNFGFKSIANNEEINEEDIKVNGGEASSHGNSVSFEFISAKNPNYLLVIDRGSTIGQSDELASDTLDNSLINSTKASINDNIIYLDGAAWYLATGGITATEIMIEDLMQAIE